MDGKKKAAVVSLMPRGRLEAAKVAVPEELDVLFSQDHSPEGIIAACRGREFLFVPAAYPPITRGILENLPTIRLIQSSGIGYDKVDAAAAAEFGIPVANVPAENITTVAEFAVGALIALLRQFGLADRRVKAGDYTGVREVFFKMGLREVADCRVGLVGLGGIGRRVAEIAGGLGARIAYFDPVRAPEAVEARLKAVFLPFESLIAECDVISLHVPLTDKTRNLIGRAELSRMRTGAILINTARGEIVDPAALAEALEGGRLAGAAIDTVFPEPPPPGHPLLNLSPAAADRLLLTPHVAGLTGSAFARLLSAALANVVRTAAGDPPRHVVNGVPAARAEGRDPGVRH
jgi:phosphoglycerate dehydrogenase-like enzyme